MKIPAVDWEPWRTSRKSPWREPERNGWFPTLVDNVELQGAEHLIEAIRGVESRGDRLVITFRHCGDADPHGVYYTLNTLTKYPFRRPRFLFLASAEIALWGGGLTDFALRAGGTLALAHGPEARRALDFLQIHLKNSPDPVVIAPEGQITYELDGPIVLDPGAANIALWAAGTAAGDAKVVPLGVRYLCPQETWRRWDRFVDALELGVGLPRWATPAGKKQDVEASATRRLRRLWDHLLTLAEDYYRNKHCRKLPPLSTLNERCDRLTRVAVEVGARMRDIPVGDDLRGAIFELRYSAMHLVFPRPRGLSRVEKAMDDRAAAEGWWNNRHQDLADLTQFLHPDALPDELSLERAVETALNLADLAGRLSGGNVKHRPRYFRRTLRVTVGEPWAVEKTDDRSRKVRAAEITDRIKQSLEALRG